jgi:hypothetical protein
MEVMMRVKRSAYAKLEPIEVIVVNASKSKKSINTIIFEIKKHLPFVCEWSIFSSNDKFIWIKPSSKTKCFVETHSKILNTYFSKEGIKVGTGNWN